MFDLREKNALVIGATGGIGRSIAMGLAEGGASVGIHYRSAKGEALQLAEKIRGLGSRAYVFQADLTQWEEADALASEAIRQMERIDILVNSAGIRKDSLLMWMTPQEHDFVMAGNLSVVFNTCRAVIRHMIGNRSGRILNLSSLSGVTGLPGQTHYAAAKAGVIGFTKALAQEVARFGITVNVVAPGLIRTAMTEGDSSPSQDIIGRIPIGRIGEPSEVAAPVCFLVSDMAEYITGQVVIVDGGLR